MADDPKAGAGFSLKRWSQRKHESARGARPVPPSGDDSTSPPPVAPAAPAADAVAAPTSPVPVELPPVETLTFDSDFAAFMQPKVEEATRRAALKKLFGDPSFNVMDGLDIYVGDYTQPDPMPAGMLDRLANVYGLLDPTASESASAEHVMDSARLPPMALHEAPKVAAAALPAPAPGVSAPEGCPVAPVELSEPAEEDSDRVAAAAADTDPNRA
jgi:hypothetical protein